MNIDELKDAWNSDDQNKNDINEPLQNAITGKTSSATAKLRSNMKNEGIGAVVSYIIILVFLFCVPHTSFLFNITCILLFIMVIFNAYYFFRFYIFYKSISRYDLNLKDSIRKITYELELNMEIYKAYNFCITPLAVIVAIGLIIGQKTSLFIQHYLSDNNAIATGPLLFIFANILISFIIVYILLNWHVKLKYGKYLTELKQVMNDLEDEG